MNITQDWREQDRRYYGKVTQAKSDSFAESRLFTDNALAALLNRHLVEKIDVCTMGHDPNFRINTAAVF